MGSFIHAAKGYPLQGMCKINNWKTFSLLQLARAVFPAVRGWTSAAEARGAGLRNEFGASLRWPGRP